MSQYIFDEDETLHQIKHYLPAQAPLKDFVHHNTLHAFQDRRFFTALHESSKIFGYKTYLSLAEYRELYKEGKIDKNVFDSLLYKKKGEESHLWEDKLINKAYDTSIDQRIGALRWIWNKQYHVKLDKTVQANLFRIVNSYLDQGISIWSFPIHKKGFLASLRELEKSSKISFFKTSRPKKLLQDKSLQIADLLKILVGDESYYGRYLFDQQFTHPGWSGMVAYLEDHPESLFDRKSISLHEFIFIELLLEIDYLDHKLGDTWFPLATKIDKPILPLFSDVPYSELFEVYQLWQEVYEWTYYDQVLAGIEKEPVTHMEPASDKTFQALFCIDDRICSYRRHIERLDSNCATYGTAGYFNVELFYQPVGSKFYSKLCPAPITPKHLIQEKGDGRKRDKDYHFNKHSHSLVKGWLISQTLGFWSALKLFVNIFRPTVSPATTASFQHLDKAADLVIENRPTYREENGLKIGFTVSEMADRAEGLMRSIGLITDFAPIVYLVGHGATSVNNTHYAGYDCGACSGRPGSVNAKVMAFMANHPEVRQLLAQRGIHIPYSTWFIAGLHDTTRDEIIFFDEHLLDPDQQIKHEKNKQIFSEALKYNAKERSRKFDLIDSKGDLEIVHKEVKKRSISLFEPRPELNHATNALCIVGRRDLSKHLFLDRRAFLNSYDYQTDPDGTYLLGILGAVAPVCGGINLEYYFSRVDNYKLGAGTKLPHNVVGLIGVANGISGDLRPGLPSQMIEVHSPIRLLTIVEHLPEVVLKAISTHKHTYQWFKNEWVRLIALHPETKQFYVYEGEKFVQYDTVNKKIDTMKNEQGIFEKESDNLPVYTLN